MTTNATIDLLDQEMTLASTGPSFAESAAQAAASLAELLRTEVAVCDGRTGEPLAGSYGPGLADLADLIVAVTQRTGPEFIWEDDPLALLAVPLTHDRRGTLVAVAPFVTGQLAAGRNFARLAGLLGRTAAETETWARQQPVVAAPAAEQLVRLAANQLSSQEQIVRLRKESESLSKQIASTYEEISLIYRLTYNLKISSGDEQLGRQALEWLSEVIPACGFALQFVRPPDIDNEELTPTEPPAFLTFGDCPLDSTQFAQLVESLGMGADHRPLVANRGMARALCHDFPAIRELIVVPLAEGELVFGWLAAFNRLDGAEFGTIEANLLSSIATILGIHASNTELYRQQAELMAGIVRALTSAIDAKDPYTHGHSDRVARVAVRLGRELGCSPQALKTIYLGGLLHDVGKIGISDAVLGKPGKLTPEEFEHIKTHVEIGYNILVDLRKLGQILPIVRHHHEAYDGTGYPDQLTGETIPWLARIVAVADAFDAMGSDRPYRPGMNDDKLDEIMRNGRGKQWDARVVDAFFRIRDEIRAIGRESDLAGAHIGSAATPP